MAKPLINSLSLRASKLFQLARSMAQDPCSTMRRSSSFIRSSTRSEVGLRSSSTIRPSARNTTRSGRVAAVSEPCPSGRSARRRRGTPDRRSGCACRDRGGRPAHGLSRGGWRSATECFPEPFPGLGWRPQPAQPGSTPRQRRKNPELPLSHPRRMRATRRAAPLLRGNRPLLVTYLRGPRSPCHPSRRRHPGPPERPFRACRR